MAKGKSHKPRRHGAKNSSARPAPRGPYHGNARFLEVGSAGVPFRQLINVDQITNVRFEEQIEQHEFPVPPQQEGDEATTQTRNVCVGWMIVVCFNENNTSVGFADIKAAMALYNFLVNQVVDLGIPTSRLPELAPPEQPSGIVDADGQPVDAAELHPDLAGGEGDGVNEDAFELTDEDVELLEHPEIDEDAIAEAFEPVEEEPPAH